MWKRPEKSLLPSAIRYANRYKLADVIITGRGGGSIEDLWAFNDERVARAIYDSEIPVISAVGHEPDVTISDFVADARASTPSNAAEIAVPDMAELKKSIAAAKERMLRAEERKIAKLSDSVAALSQKRALREPMAFIQDKRVLLDYTQNRLVSSVDKILGSQREKFGRLAASLDALSPLKVLGRGYAVARKESGEIVKSAADVSCGERVDITLGAGELRCTVYEVRE